MKKMLTMLLCAVFCITYLTVPYVYADDEEEELYEEVETEEKIIEDEIIEDDLTEETVDEGEEEIPTDTKEDVYEAVAVPDGITVILDGKTVVFDAAQPKLVDGRTLVPMRKFFEHFGADVNWDDATFTAKAVKGELSVEISIGSNVMYNNGTPFVLDVPAQLIYSRTYVPVRFISEALGADVEWDDYRKIVYINTLK